MRIAIAGCHYGHIGGIIRSAAEADNGEIVAVAEQDAERVGWYEPLKGVDRYDTIADMLEKAKPDLVIEGITHSEKADLIEACAKVGAHVLLDKPLCKTAEELDRISKAVESGGIKLSMYDTSRFYPPFVALREALEAGHLGKIVSYISTHPHKLGKGSPFYFGAGYAGVFHDVACHGVDQLRFLTGAECVGVHAVGADVHRHTGEKAFPHDHIQASFTMSDGSTGLLTADWLTPSASKSWGDTRVIIMGTEGSAHLSAYAGDGLKIVSESKGEYEPDMPKSNIDAFVSDMISTIEGGNEPFISTQDVLAVARACIVAEESVRQNGAFLPIE